jgi:hypothetical protein
MERARKTSNFDQVKSQAISDAETPTKQSAALHS